MNSKTKQILLLILAIIGAFFVNLERSYIGFPDGYKSDKGLVLEKIYYTIFGILLIVSVFLIIKIFKKSNNKGSSKRKSL